MDFLKFCKALILYGEWFGIVNKEISLILSRVLALGWCLKFVSVKDLENK